MRFFPYSFRRIRLYLVESRGSANVIPSPSRLRPVFFFLWPDDRRQGILDDIGDRCLTVAEVDAKLEADGWPPECAWPLVADPVAVPHLQFGHVKHLLMFAFIRSVPGCISAV